MSEENQVSEKTFRYLQRLTPSKLTKQIKRRAFHSVQSSHGNGKGFAFSGKNASQRTRLASAFTGFKKFPKIIEA
jgi:hypothetical protein